MLPTGDTDEQVDGVDNSWSQEEVAKERILHKTSRSMEEGQDVEDDVKVVGVPEGLEGVTSGVLSGKHENNDSNQCRNESSKASHGQEEPVGELGQGVGTMVHLTEDAGQVVGSLGRDVVEVEAVTDAMHHREEETIEGNDLVEADVGVEGDVVVEDGLPEVGDEVASHCEQENGVSPHHSRGSSTSDGHTMTCDSPQTSMLSLNCIVVASLHKDTDGDKLEEHEIEDVKPVVLHPAQEYSNISAKSTLGECSLLNRDIEGWSGFSTLAFLLLGSWVTLACPAVCSDDGTTSTCCGGLA